MYCMTVYVHECFEILNFWLCVVGHAHCQCCGLERYARSKLNIRGPAELDEIV